MEEKSTFRKEFFYIAGGVIFLLSFYFLVLGAPNNFPINQIFSIDSGTSLRKVSGELKAENIIRSQTLFEAFVILRGGEKHIISGKYLFEEKLPVWIIASRISKGERGVTAVKVTFPEGSTVDSMADILAQKLRDFNTGEFKNLAKGEEGYLFPDTYFFFDTDEPGMIVKILRENFDKKIESLRSEIEKSGKSLEEIVTMASIIEREASGKEDREMISGILWKRLKIGMPLQADAAPVTYEQKGLPQKPIANPGFFSIKAAIYPKDSPYLYYIHDKEGNIYYAKDFATHRANINKYLK